MRWPRLALTASLRGVKVEWRNEDRLTDYCGQSVKGKFIHCPKAASGLCNGLNSPT